MNLLKYALKYKTMATKKQILDTIEEMVLLEPQSHMISVVYDYTRKQKELSSKK